MTGIPARCTVPGQEAAQPELEILLQPGHGNVAAMTTSVSVSCVPPVSEREEHWRLEVGRHGGAGVTAMVGVGIR